MKELTRMIKSKINDAGRPITVRMRPRLSSIQRMNRRLIELSSAIFYYVYVQVRNERSSRVGPLILFLSLLAKRISSLLTQLNLLALFHKAFFACSQP